MAGESAGKVAKTFSTDAPLKDLWENSLDLQDQFSQAMGTKYSSRSGLKNWRHLSERFNISPLDYESFSGSENISPSEKMLEYLETAKPDLKVSQFKEACERARLYEISNFLTRVITARKIKENDAIAALWVEPNLLLMLDRNELWMDVARKLNIPMEDYQTFKYDPGSNWQARDLFDILTIEEIPEEIDQPLDIAGLKTKLVKIKQQKLKNMLDENELPGDTLLKAIRTPLSEIEQGLNKDEFVYKLAQLYKNDGCLKRHDIEMFRPCNHSCPPTNKLIEHVIQTYPEGREPTVRDLILHLMEIQRNSDLDLFENYLQGGKSDLTTIRAEYEMPNLRVAPTRHERQPPTQTEDGVHTPIQNTDEPATQDVRPDQAELRNRRVNLYQYAQTE